MAVQASYRKKATKPRGPAVGSPVAKEPDDDSPSKRQCLSDVTKGVSSNNEKQTRKTSSKVKAEAGFKSGRPSVESRNSFARSSQDGRDRKGVKEKRSLVEGSPLTPTRPAPRPPFSRNTMPYSSLPVAPPKPPRTYEQLPSPSLYPSLSPTLGERTIAKTDRKGVVPIPAPRGRTRGEPTQPKDSGVFCSTDDIYPPVTTQRLENKKNTKDNIPLKSPDIPPEEPTRKPVSSRLLEWQRRATDNSKENRPEKTPVTPALRHAERSRKALSSALEKSAPSPAPRSGTRSESNDRLSCDIGESRRGTEDATRGGSAYERVEEPLSAVQMGSKEQFSWKQNVNSGNAKTPQKKRNAPMPPSTNASDNVETKPKNLLYPDITDTSTHTYFVLEEPESSLQKQSKTSNAVKALTRIPVSCSSDIYDFSGSVDLGEIVANEASHGMVSECLAGFTGDFKSDFRGNGYSLAGEIRGEYAVEEEEDDGENIYGENIYCEIDSPAATLDSRKTEVYEKSSCQDSKPRILQTTHINDDQHASTKHRAVFCLESERLAGNQSPGKAEKPKVPPMTPTSPGNHRLVWSKKTAIPTITISHKMASRSDDSQDEANDTDDLPFIPDPSVKLQLQTLQDLVYQEMNVIHQTSNALAQCCHDLSAFSGSAEALECHRIILMACKKREAYVMEMQRLREARSGTDDAGPRGILTVSNIKLPLKPEFMSKIGTSFDTSVHHFVVMIRNGCHVFFTQLLSTHGAMVRGSLDFSDSFEITDIRQKTFTVGVEVYGMSLERTPGVYSSKKKKKRALNPMKALTPSCTRRALSPGSLGSVRTSNFINIASLRLDATHLSKMNFSLDRIPFSSPLRGSIHLEMHCQMESQIEERGFLTMFEDRCGYGTWYRRWCVLGNTRLSYWKYPGEESEKDPIGFVDLKQCVSDTVDLVSRSYCARPNTFEMVILKTKLNDDHGSIVHEGGNASDSVVKLWFSSDTQEERLNWCSQLSAALVNLRTWHSDAAKPDKTRRQDRDDVQSE